MVLVGERRPGVVPLRRRDAAHQDAPHWTTRLQPHIEAMNKHVCVLPRNWPAGILVIGAQGAGKTSVMLKQLQNALLDRGAAVVLIDPKRTLARRALALIPPQLAKRVWYLNLSRPAFGMSPLRITAPDQAISDLVTAGLRDVFPDQLFQASRDTIDNAVRGALALAHAEDRYPSLEDTRELLLWANGELRSRAIEALKRTPNGDRVHQYFSVEMPAEMAQNAARTLDRLRAPRNKLDGLLNAESLRVFFNHTYEKPVAEIVRDREVLIVDADLGKAGEENSQLVIAFILRMLSQALRDQMDLEERERSRVHLLIDESAQVLRESTIEMFEQHRESGLTAAVAAHYTAQFGDERILAGVLALLANRFMFRSADPEDGERMTKIARAVLAAPRDTPQSRARQRVGPEVMRDLRQFSALCALLGTDGREPAFIGWSYRMPEFPELGGHTRHHLEVLAQEVGSYPENLVWELGERALRQTQELLSTRGAATPQGPADDEAGATADELPPDRPPASDGTPSAPRRSPRALARAAHQAASPARLEHGLEALGLDPTRITVPAPDAIRELHENDEVVQRGSEPVDASTPSPGPIPRLTDRDMLALSALDRLGYMTLSQLHRLCWPERQRKTARANLEKLARAELIHRYPLRSSRDRGGRSSHLYALGKRGLEAGKHPPGNQRAVIADRREYRPSAAIEGQTIRHGLTVGSWLISYLRALPTVTSERWWTERYAQGHIDVPTVAAERGRKRPLEIDDVVVAADGFGGRSTLHGVDSPKPLVPDLIVQERFARDGEPPLTTDLIVEIDNTGKPAYNREKFRAYDSFLCGWSLMHDRYQAHGTRPVALFVARTREHMLALMRAADEEMRGSIGQAGVNEVNRWYYAGRDHVLFTWQDLIHYGLPCAWMLPVYPPRVRAQLGEDYRVEPVSLVAPKLLAKDAMVGWTLRGGRAVPVTAEEGAELLTLLAALAAGIAGVAGVASGATRWAAARRTRTRCAIAAERLDAARRDWWAATRAYDSDAAAAAFRLRRYGQAVLDSATALEILERETGRARDWPGPPPQPRDLLPGAARRGPPEWWQRFDRAYEACCGLLHPADDCYALGQVALVLADWIEKHDGEPPGEERAGRDAAFVHAASAPCLATIAAASVVREDGALRLDIAALEERAAEDGHSAQGIMLSLADTLIGRCENGPTIGELLTLDDTDVCYALEAVALARGLRRVYPAQRPELLWMQAALAQSDREDGTAQ